MNEIISNYLSNFEFGKTQTFKNMAVVPLFTNINHSPKYLTLSEAIKKNLITVTEVDEYGTVPTLKVKNDANISVLMLAGEELVGAKQNRILNTTILLKKRSETIIPVSCTEAGRWHYVSSKFKESEVMASPNIRKINAEAVADSLKSSGSFSSDQEAVWENIAEMSMRANVNSPTEAMDDIFKHKETTLKDYLDAFPYVPHQRGIFIFINGKEIGFDFISLEEAYEKLHLKLVKSYAMEAILENKKTTRKPPLKKAKAFINNIKNCKEEKYKSVGHGWDYRYISDTIVGSVLLYRKKAIHMSFFRSEKSELAGKISGYKTRRRFVY